MRNQQIIDEASEWFMRMRLDEPTADSQEQFMQWLRTSPEHVRAYLELVELWDELPAVDPGRNLTADALIAAARAEGNVFPLTPARIEARPFDGATFPASQRARGRSALAARLAALLLIVVAGFWVYAYRANTFATDVAEQRSFRLTDGTAVKLNSRSRIRVRFSEHARAVDLLEGQALFEVAKDPTRPFRVHSGNAVVRAVGTAFDVNRRRDATIVTVVEGRVLVTDGATEDARASRGAGTESTSSLRWQLAADKPPEGIVLSQGEQVTITPASILIPAPADISAATIWTRGQLMFRSTPLSQVVEEFNRYNTRRVVLDDGIEDFPVTAVFSSTDSKSLVSFLSQQPNLTIETGDQEIRIVPIPVAR